MVLSEEKQAKLAGILTRRQGMSVAPSPTPSIPAIAVPLYATQSSLAPFP